MMTSVPSGTRPPESGFLLLSTSLKLYRFSISRGFNGVMEVNSVRKRV